MKVTQNYSAKALLCMGFTGNLALVQEGWGEGGRGTEGWGETDYHIVSRFSELTAVMLVKKGAGSRD